jgi:hypothetical protein
VFSARSVLGHPEPFGDFPPNLLIAMGLSVTTLVGAKAITVQYVTTQQISKPDQSKTSNKVTGPGAILQDDSGSIDLTKVQLVAWTFVALSVYLVRLLSGINDALPPSNCVGSCSLGNPPTLPDIDTALMVLTGLATGTYLGRKLIPTGIPFLERLSPSAGTPPLGVILSGAGFGDAPNGNSVTLSWEEHIGDTTESKSMPAPTSAWTDSKITMQFPARPAADKLWEAGTTVGVAVVVAGQTSDPLPFAVKNPPYIKSITPGQGKPPISVTITGTGFGADQQGAAGAILLNGVAREDIKIAGQNWRDTTITFMFPATKDVTTPWLQNTNVTIAVRTGDYQSNTEPFMILP